MSNYVGIYCIENIINHKRYIGQSRNINARIAGHKNLLKKNKHDNLHLQRSWKEYGEQNFLFYILELCTIDELNEREKYYIKQYKTDDINYGFNMTSGGDYDYCLNEEIKKKISQKMLGKMSGDKNPNYGRRLTDEEKKKISIRNSNPSKEIREKLRAARLGKKHSPETIEKLKIKRKQQKRGPVSEETKRKISIATKERFKTEKPTMFGKHHSEEAKKKIGDGHRNPTIQTREKMSASAKKRWEENPPTHYRSMKEENNPNAKKVYQYSEDYQLIKIWNTLKSICVNFNVSLSTVSGTWLKNEDKKYRGFFWSLKTKEEK